MIRKYRIRHRYLTLSIFAFRLILPSPFQRRFKAEILCWLIERSPAARKAMLFQRSPRLSSMGASLRRYFRDAKASLMRARVISFHTPIMLSIYATRIFRCSRLSSHLALFTSHYGRRFRERFDIMRFHFILSDGRLFACFRQPYSRACLLYFSHSFRD